MSKQRRTKKTAEIQKEIKEEPQVLLKKYLLKANGEPVNVPLKCFEKTELGGYKHVNVRKLLPARFKVMKEYVEQTACDAYPTALWGPLVAVSSSGDPPKGEMSGPAQLREFALGSGLIVCEGLHRLSVLGALYEEGKLHYDEVPCLVLSVETPEKVLRKIGATFNQGHDMALRTTLGERLELGRRAMEDLCVTWQQLNETRKTKKSGEHYNKVVREVHEALGRAPDKLTQTKNELQSLRLPPKVVDAIVEEFNRTAVVSADGETTESRSRLLTAHLLVPANGPFSWLAEVHPDLCLALIEETTRFEKVPKDLREKLYLKHAYRGWLFRGVEQYLTNFFSTQKRKDALNRALDSLVAEVLPRLLQGDFDLRDDAEYKLSKPHGTPKKRKQEQARKPEPNVGLTEGVKASVQAFLQTASASGCFTVATNARAHSKVKLPAWQPVYSKNDVDELFNKSETIWKFPLEHEATDSEHSEVELERAAKRHEAEGGEGEEDDYYLHAWDEWPLRFPKYDACNPTQYVQLFNLDFFSAQAQAKLPNDVDLWLVDAPFGVFKNPDEQVFPMDEPLKDGQLVSLFETVRLHSKPRGASLLSYCAWDGETVSFAAQQDALKKANLAGQDSAPRWECQRYPFVYLTSPVAKAASVKTPYLNATSVTTPLFYARTANKDPGNFHFRWEKSPDSGWKNNVLSGYHRKTPSELSADKLVAPVQKPEGLSVELLLRFTHPGDTVVVPFAGSGSEVLACIKTGRKVFAFEKDATNYELARSRVNALCAQLVQQGKNAAQVRFRFPKPEELAEERKTRPNSVFLWSGVNLKQEFQEYLNKHAPKAKKKGKGKRDDEEEEQADAEKSSDGEGETDDPVDETQDTMDEDDDPQEEPTTAGPRSAAEKRTVTIPSDAAADLAALASP